MKGALLCQILLLRMMLLTTSLFRKVVAQLCFVHHQISQHQNTVPIQNVVGVIYDLSAIANKPAVKLTFGYKEIYYGRRSCL